MEARENIEKFRQIVHNKYLIYNSLFLNLPNENTSYTGVYIPLLHKLSKEGFANAQEPKQIIEEFFSKHTNITSAQEKFNLLFRMVQYIERQVVLFDCVEDAAFPSFQKQELLSLLKPNAGTFEDLKKHLSQFSTRLVFTAHPTQFYSNSVQTIMSGLRSAIKDDSITRIDALLQQLAFTPFINREKPTPYDEAQSIIYYLRYVYYNTMGTLYHQIAQSLGVSPDFNPQLIELGFWPGGDRDGNPFVTADITLKVALQLRNTIMKCYYNHLKLLRQKLTFREVVAPLAKLKELLYKQIFQYEVSLTDKEILDILYDVRQKVVKLYRGQYLAEIDDFIGRVHLFGSHFATLDIRQDSSKHYEIMAQIFKKEFDLDYHALKDSEKIAYLTEKSLQIKPEDYADELTQDTLRNVYQIKTIQQNNGKRGLHRYIISNSENIFDVLNVYALFKYCGYQPQEIDIDIVPLFETMQGMKHAKATMNALYENEVYKAHLQHRQNSQTIMLGFSDGTKDGGYLKANWEIYNTKATLTELTRSKGYQVIFFDGRGGPPARGGGKTHQFYAAQGSEIANDKIQLTIQGQTITSIFGTHEQASYNVQQLLMAGSKSLQKNSELSAEDKALMDDLAEKSYQKYTALKEHPLFVPYLEEMTTLRYYGDTNIGSRPTKRNQNAQLTLKDLRAIPFVGSWSLIRQNVPGYYGLGTALESYAHTPQAIEQLYKNSAFFKCLIHNSIMSMKKSHFPLTAYMQDHPKYGEFWQDLREEYLLAKKWVLHLTQQQELMENEALSRSSISMRENIILPLLTIQQYALQMIQEEDEHKAIFEKMVIRALFGNINASRNSA